MLVTVMKKSLNKSKNILIKGGVVLTINPSEDIFSEGYVLIEDDTIKSIGTITDAPPEGTVEKVIDARDGLIMPGLINTHTHAAMACLRGLADDLPLETWLNDYIFPVEAHYANPEFVYQGTRLAGIEMIRSGTTCFADGYFFEEQAVRAVSHLGLRAILGQGVLDFPTPDVPHPGFNLKNGKNYLEQFPASSLIVPTLFCHSAYTCKPETLQEARKVCNYHGIPLLTHLAETEAEVRKMMSRYGVSPVKHLLTLGVLDGETIAAHCIWISPEELPLLKKKKVRVAHCPESNMKLASGVAPVPEFLKLGIPVGLGTDGCASNNNLDLFSEMDTAAKIHKLARQDPSLMDAKTVVKLATIGGAEVLGLRDKVGSLEPGKKADIIILDWKQAHLTPVYNYYSHLVYSATGHDVRTVIVDGKVIMDNRQISTVNEKEVISAVEKIGEEIKKGRRNNLR
jgi:5-methylthioadenosine/S-adenosylhomocysteine deaminase